LRASDGYDETRLVVSAASRPLRRQLRALAWLTLEEVALDAEGEGGRLVARTSARQVAERLRIDPGTAAGALRLLRERGLLTVERGHGPAGRFGLSIYVLGSVSGLTVVPPRTVQACVVSPPMEKSAVGVAPVDDPRLDPPGVAQPRMGGPHAGEPPSPPSLQCPGQGALELRKTPS
jgi:hypothetical protein